MTPPRYSTVGSLAAALREAAADLREIERDVDEFLVALLPGWRPLFPSSRGWRFTSPDVLDVFETTASPAALDALHRAGFRRVVVHAHADDAPCGRDCAPRIDPSLADPLPPTPGAGPATKK